MFCFLFVPLLWLWKWRLWHAAKGHRSDLSDGLLQRGHTLCKRGACSTNSASVTPPPQEKVLIFNIERIRLCKTSLLLCLFQTGTLDKWCSCSSVEFWPCLKSAAAYHLEPYIKRKIQATFLWRINASDAFLLHDTLCKQPATQTPQPLLFCLFVCMFVSQQAHVCRCIQAWNQISFLPLPVLLFLAKMLGGLTLPLTDQWAANSPVLSFWPRTTSQIHQNTETDN